MRHIALFGFGLFLSLSTAALCQEPEAQSSVLYQRGLARLEEAGVRLAQGGSFDTNPLWGGLLAAVMADPARDRAGLLRAAEADFRASIAILQRTHPDGGYDLGARSDLAFVLVLLGEYEDALSQYNHMIPVTPSTGDFHSLLMRCFLRGVLMNDPAGGIADCTVAADVGLLPAEAQALRGMILLKVERNNEALSDLHCRQTASEAAICHYARGVALLRNGRRAEAEAEMARGRRDDPNVERWFARAGLYP